MEGYLFDDFAVCVSTTQLDMFDEKTGCPRKWAFRYLAKIKTPQGAGAALGTEVQDTQIDPWLESGRPIDFSRPSGEIAQAVVPLMPAPMSPGMKIRRKFTMPAAGGGFAYIGEIDVWAPDSRIVPGLEGGVPLCGDLKTTKDLKYAKDEEALRTDIQANLYATYLLVADKAEAVDLVWWYSRTRKKYRAQRTHLRVLASHATEQFQRIDEIGQRLSATRIANPKPDELPPNPRMCDQYGGCAYRHLCNLSPLVHAAAVNLEAIRMNAATPTFLDDLRKQAGAAPLVPAPPGTAPGTPGTHTLLAPIPALGAGPGVYVNPPPAAAPSIPAAPFPAPPGFVWNGTGFVPAAAPAPAHVAPPAPPAVIDTPAAAAAAGLPAFLTQPVGPNPGIIGAPPVPAINPPESRLPPAPPVGAAAPAAAPEEKAKRTRGPNKPKTDEAAVALSFDALDFPRAEFAAFLEAWAAKVRAGS